MQSPKDIAEGVAWLGLGIGAWLGIVAVVLFLGSTGSIIAWRTTHYTAAATAPDRVQVRNLDTDNIIQKQNYFAATNQDYERELAQIALYKTKIKNDAHADAIQRQADSDGLTGSQQSCLATASDYNAQAANSNSGQFRNGSLPQSLDLGACTK